MNPGDEAPAGTPGTGDNVCPVCHGTGKVRGAEACANCGGTGRIVAGIGGA
jgi:RecJ-like exonuclease